ncbi:MAG: preprotein translocase subunit SecY [archaeon YNP-LCB-003-016]|jgi:preprotein translocase subunit SecY|uniref:preprotein translocase subunit SecY n=1 Tax=Candidatus Culexarchaeum yellowstonense TaxID=2928963 RepID=UPI0026EB4FA8|nr:preprotein translocase subunit SecY [Candidatus Culexarchaeum yellowstonense]MCR6691248.1 preprotein translocase subunit SecY [Candidatus Culexarchaeum yellowstonense]
MPRILELLEPVTRILPEVEKPKQKLPLRDRLIWTAVVLTLYFIMSEIPLYGIKGALGYDPFMYMRWLFASKRGTLMELGIGPIVTAGLIMQLLVGSKIIELDFTNPRDRALFSASQKLMTLIWGAIQSISYILGGAFGQLDIYTSIIIFLQLMITTLLLMLMDEMIQKGWGLGSGVSLFIAAGIAQQMFWETFSPVIGSDGKYIGAILYTAQTLLSGGGLMNALIRPYGLPSLTGLIVTTVILLFVIYMEGTRIEVPITMAKYRGIRTKIPLKFLYVSNIPIIFTSMLFVDIQIISLLIWRQFNVNNTNIILNLIGTFNQTTNTPIGGLAYYTKPPSGISSVISDPIHAIIYSALLIISSVIFSIIWVQASGLSPRDQAEQLVESGLQIPGFRSSPKVIEGILNRYIPPLTILSGIIVALIAIVADLLGAIGSGMGILLVVGIIYQYWGMLTQEQMMEAYPILKRLAGER